MCGIAGIYSYHYAANPIDRAELRRLRDHMAARGPDGAGEWCTADNRVGLAHRRLSIIDLSEDGAQPMVDADANAVITFNGEIYNYKALRRGLEQQGHVFRTDSDTEVLLHLYAAKGPRMADDLRGMFAFALWDGARRRLLLARDPYGIKPLYYADDGWTLRFASQVKALVAGGGVSCAPEPAGWAGFLLFGSIPEPYTNYQEIRAVPAGATMWVDSCGPAKPANYFSVSAEIRAAEDRLPARPGDVQERAREALLDSVRHHLVADVPVGIFLSAGVDSGALLGLMRDVSTAEIHSVTLAYEDFRNRREDEAPGARAVAASYASTHTTRVVTESEFRADLPKIFEAMDQPTVDGINTWFVSKAARELGLKAAVSGLGGDELFAGYPSFRDIPRWVRWGRLPSHVPFLGDLVRRLIAGSRRLHPKTAALVKYAGSYAGAYLLRRGIFMPWELGQVMDRDFMAEGVRRLDPLGIIAASAGPLPRTAIGKVASFEACVYLRNQLLRDTDWAGMAHSVEVRVPFVDRRLLTEIAPLVMSLPPGTGKRLVAASPRKPLPDAVVDRKKTGFETPIKDWLQRDDRTQTWRRIPELARASCPWARRWAYQLATLAEARPLA
ncbi:MAG TPA: asparagine synthase (glutamine-hydrolyzing) [Stellaceae bacterium]|jgi:asparagine synthase (glutamine-hydrolysing)